MKHILLLLSLLIFTTPLLSENYMDLLATMEGEHGKSQFGEGVAVLDFNDDGYDDVVVGSPKWGPEGGNEEYHWGRIYFYLGGDPFDADADFTITSPNANWNLGYNIANIGDVNNDGIEDFGFTHREEGITNFVKILYGSVECDTTVDFTYEIPGATNFIGPITWMGDINNDGYDDAAFWINVDWTFDYYLIWGGDTLTVEYFGNFGLSSYATRIHGVGDVNDDGYDDFEMGYNTQYPDWSFRNVFYYGNDGSDPFEQVILCDSLSTYEYYIPAGYPAGDFNGDGKDDFWGFLGYNLKKVWFNSPVIDTIPDLIFQNSGGGLSGDNAIDYGDLNNDGYDDQVLGSPSYGVYTGRIMVFIGSAHANTSIDLELEAYTYNKYFGYELKVGDVNGDGFADIAASAPKDYGGGDIYRGKVYVYAGNADLAETTPYSINEPGSSGEIGQSFMNVYPNPFTNEINFEIKTNNLRDLQVHIYNIKGQLMETLIVDDKNFVWSPVDLSPGTYFCKLLSKDKVLEVKKLTLVK